MEVQRERLIEEIERLRSGEENLIEIQNKFSRRKALMENNPYLYERYQAFQTKINILKNRRKVAERELTDLYIEGSTSFLELVETNDLRGILTAEDLKIIDDVLNNPINQELLKEIFISYASYASPLKIDRLGKQNFVRLLSDTHVFDDQIITQGKGLSIFTKLSKLNSVSYLTFEVFLKALSLIANEKYPLTCEVDSTVSLRLLVNGHLFRYGKHISDADLLRLSSPIKSSRGEFSSRMKVLSPRQIMVGQGSLPQEVIPIPKKRIKSPIIKPFIQKENEVRKEGYINPPTPPGIIEEKQFSPRPPQKVVRMRISPPNINTNTNTLLVGEGNIRELKVFKNTRTIKLLRLVFEDYMTKDSKHIGSRGKLSQSQFIKLGQHFKITPRLCNKSIIKSAFLHSIGSQTVEGPTTSAKLVVSATFDQFLLSLAKIGEYIYRNEPQVSLNKKIFLLLTLMDEAEYLERILIAHNQMTHFRTPSFINKQIDRLLLFQQ